MSPRVALMVVLVASGAACAAPGGAVSGTVLTESGLPVPGARLDFDFGDGGAFNTSPSEDGHFISAWSHGSWHSIAIAASAPGRQSARATIGWGGWTCTFRLAAADAAPETSRATCRKDAS